MGCDTLSCTLLADLHVEKCRRLPPLLLQVKNQQSAALPSPNPLSPNPLRCHLLPASTWRQALTQEQVVMLQQVMPGSLQCHSHWVRVVPIRPLVANLVLQFKSLNRFLNPTRQRTRAVQSLQRTKRAEK